MDDLLDLLKDLDKAIVGKYFVWGGLMLGLHRDGKPIDGDNDIDIVLVDDAYIDYSKLPESVGSQKYYMQEKIYRRGYPTFKPKNKWTEYISYIRMLPENLGKNRCQILKIASKSYSDEYIKPEFSNIYIDVDYLKLDKDSQYKNKYFPKCYLKEKEIKSIQYVEYASMHIPMPTYLDDVCERHYGETWNIPDANWKY
tara:strand:+ start:70 stop:663 length:594 start_codon:yes stop_codon:yes gene_type:complete